MADSNENAGADGDLPSDSLYVSAPKIYPREADGLFHRARRASVVVLLGLYYAVVWLHHDGQQLVLFDLPGRKFHVFGLTIFPQDLLLLALLLIAAALSLFLFTAIAGRMWCGYACPQTVWTEVFIWIERSIEGDRRARMRLDEQPWTPRKTMLKIFKHGVWVVFSLWTGFTFVGYFTPVVDLGRSVISFSLGGWETFWISFYSLATYGNAGWLREQVCLYMCPYARFQSAMFDNDSLIVSYDRSRGEPRGGRRRGAPKKDGLGDCIDCSLCVQVCPTGIDIRAGLQYQCIACAACVDVCNTVMDRMGYERGLVRYSTSNSLAGRKGRVLRIRTAVYCALLLAVVTSFAAALITRDLLVIDVMRDRNALYREVGRGYLENVYTFKLVNKDTVAHPVQIEVKGVAGLLLEVEGAELFLQPESVQAVGARVRFRPELLPASNVPVEFHLRATDDPDLHGIAHARLLKPQF